MFGSSFFFVQSCSKATVPAPCILAVNQNGLNFLSTETHVSGLSRAPAPGPLSSERPPSGAELCSGGSQPQHTSHLRDRRQELCPALSLPCPIWNMGNPSRTHPTGLS